MRQTTFTIQGTRALAPEVWELTLEGDTSGITSPGQFANIALPGRFLRRPVSVCTWTADALTLLVRELGEGTRELVRFPVGTALDLLTGLGNGFSVSAIPDRGGILAGGGIGIAPLYGLARKLRRRGTPVTAALGFRTGAEAFYVEEFAALGCEVLVSTEDGSLGSKGFVTDLLSSRQEDTYVCCCGPLPMLKAVHALPHLTGGQFSLEARMGCGFGACMGCSLSTWEGPKRVCREGPVFAWEELLW